MSTRTAPRSSFCTPSAAPVPEPMTIVLFGATGDLARRKLLPGLYYLFVSGLLPHEWRLIGVAEEDLSPEDFRRHVRAVIEEFGRLDPGGDAWGEFAARITYVGGRFAPGGTDGLRAAVEASISTLESLSKLYFAAVPPSAFAAIAQGLGEADMTDAARVVLEKPFGSDLRSARELNAIVHSVLEESQVFRIDHFLGKEAVQNLLAFRFANGLFEPVWNRGFIDHVQLDVPETPSIGTPRLVLRVDRGAARHGRHPPLPGARVRRAGAAVVPESVRTCDREGQGVRVDAPAVASRRRQRSVRGLP